MIVAPFSIVKNQMSNITLYRIRLMCEGGKMPWMEESHDMDDILQPNGIFAKTTRKITINNNQECVLAEVDTCKTDMASMYDWHEIDSTDNETLCWRTFTFGISGKTLWLPPLKNDCTPIIDAIYKYYVDI